MNINRLRKLPKSTLSSLLIAGALASGAASLSAATITIPNSNFSVSTNNGAVGGGLLGSGSDLIGTGPWYGTYDGALGLLPPTLSIHSGNATISGLAGVNILGIVNNGGYFNQTLGSVWQPNKHYVLSANVDVGSVLSAGVLASANVGLALGKPGNFFLSTATAADASVNVGLLSGTTYRVTLAYDTGNTASGNIEIALLAQPQNLVTANLLTAATFDNVSLVGSAINPIASLIGPGGGTPQSATVNTQFATALDVSVLDLDSDPVPGILVTFQAPTTGASATFSSVTALTGLDGHAHVDGFANAIAGSYTVTATVAGVLTPASFVLKNLAGAVASIGGTTGTPQNAIVNTSFTTALGANVADSHGNPIAGIGVTFNAPSTGASATFPNGNVGITDNLGHAEVLVDANTVAGNYTITATVNGSLAVASFDLANLAGVASLALPTGGTPQSAQIMTSFDSPLSAKITDAFGNPIEGVSITFTAPGLGAGATFAPGGMTVISVVTGPDGIAQVQPVANLILGLYEIVATGTGIQPATFNLTNTLLAVPHGDAVSGDGQAATVFGAFSCELKIKVTDSSSQPMQGISIDFVAPTSGASSTLSNGTNSGTTVSQTTDVNGFAAVTATANSISGKYSISAGVSGSGSSLATFDLTNLGVEDRLFSNGFDGSPDCGP
jgi:hypothetical protein